MCCEVMVVLDDVCLFAACPSCPLPSSHLFPSLLPTPLCCAMCGDSRALMIILATAFIVEVGRHPTDKEKRVAFCVTQGFIACWTVVYTYGGYHAHDNLGLYTSLLTVYNNARLAIIGITLVAMGRLYYKMRQVTHGSDRGVSPLYHLSRRLMFYPIVQIVCRLGATPYEFIYQATIDTYPENAQILQSILLFFAVGLAPTAGLGGFLVFMYMQHAAKDNLKRMLKDAVMCECKVEVLSEKETNAEDVGGVSRSARLSELTTASPLDAGDGHTVTSHQRARSKLFHT
jgi:hypothetical protein